LRLAKILVCCVLALPLVGTAPDSVSRDRAADTPSSTPEKDAIREVLSDGAGLFRAGRYGEAQQRFEAARRGALRAKLADWAARAQANVGGCQFALHQYQAALRSFLDARRAAQSADDASLSAGLDGNIASLYSEMGELEPAAEWMKNTLESLNDQDRREQLPKILIQMAIVRARQDRLEEALALYRRAIGAADREGGLELSAIAWNRIGEELLKKNRLADAEPFLLEAYRIRKLHGLALDTSYRNLGRLRLEQGDLASASALMDRAVELAERPGGVLPAWDVYQYRGRVRLAQGRFRESLNDLRVAQRLARAWRWSAPADDAGRIGAESWMDQVNSALIEAGNRLYLRTKDAALIAETFEAAEENRAGSLRALMGETRSAASLPPAYWEAIARLQREEVDALRTKAPRAEEAVGATRAELIRLEAAATPGANPAPGPVLERVRAALPPGAAMLSFHLGDSVSWLWALDRSGLALYPLPPRRELERQARAAGDAIREAAPDAAPAGAALYRTLFGAVAGRFRGRSRWLLALDRGLFDVPFAALPESLGPRPVYMAERRVCEITPGADVWLDSAARLVFSPNSDLFLGVGDPVYNTADPRLAQGPQVRSRRASPLDLFAAGAGTRLADAAGLVMPRLVASGAELEACARAWGGETLLLEGLEASRRRVVEEIGRSPAVTHFATHVLESSGSPSYGMIALSLTDRGEAEVLPPVDIAHWRIHTGLVVLSGCHSAAGAALPGTGLLGLTRAFLAAGAGSVVATRWSTLDEDGALFGAFYHHYKSQGGRDPAGALRAAQLEMMGLGDWRSTPRYWGAYFAVGGSE